MNKEETLNQYDRFLEQLRREIDNFYWLYNFFFLIEASLIYGIVSGSVVNYIFFTKFIGLLIAAYWWLVIYKQKGWRDIWLDKLKDIENKLGYPLEFQMWTQDESSFFSGRKGLWKLLMYLPIGLVVMWIGLMIY